MPTADNRRVVVITGASAGVGRAAAEMFARRGDAVALLARGEAGLAAAVKDVEAAGGIALAIPTDMADHAAVDAAAAQIENELGEIDVWVNNAFSSVFADFTDISPEEFERTTAVTYFGFVNGTRAALRYMKRRNRGVIVQTGSALARRGIALQSAYCGAKHAVGGFTESVRTELMHRPETRDIKITMVQMPALNTPQFDWVLSRLPKKSQPVPPIYEPEVAARALVHAADPKHYRREWWVGVPTVGVCIGNFFFPGLADRYVARTSYDSQQTDEPTTADRPSNLFAPADQDTAWTARGSFGPKAKARSYQWEATKHRRALYSVAAGSLGLLGTLLLKRN